MIYVNAALEASLDAGSGSGTAACAAFFGITIP